MSDPNQPYGSVPPNFPPPPGPPPGPPGFPPPGAPPSGPPGTPPYGTPVGGPGGPDGKGKGLWIGLGIAGVLALVGIIVGLVLVLTGGDDEDGDKDADDPGTSASGAAPDEVVEGLIDAAEDDDCDKAKTFMTDAAQAADPCSSAEFRLLSTGDVDAEVGDPSVDGAEATVPVRFDNQGTGEDYVFNLEQVDGAWLVASYAIDHDASSEPSATDLPTDATTDAPSTGSTDVPSPGGSSTADAVANDPKSVTEAFMESFVNGDCATAEDLVTEAYIAEEGNCDPAEVTPFASELTYEVGTPDIDEAAGTAVVPVEITVAGSTEDGTFTLVKEDGTWRINGTE
ncbi:hypothetical protein ASE01_04725 [Nocardioides sp. Root190]|uniref:DUF4878 domain-containing protein n=1 Tax=Nocardioides sp. Root190 TaxID=1736488 RepID=UPI0006FE6986|nr:DUF4878 domain-containing protein [Nocardioides sp. Root190]KRB78565.1 hypothetical protein ASE01_04725 [Nocardioides sp. Root190]